MPDYQKMYTTLFNAITDAIESIRLGSYDSAEDILIHAQQQTEELYIAAEEYRSSADSGAASFAMGEGCAFL